jgi:hypothetical protein
MTMINTNADSGTLDATGVATVAAIQGSGFRPFTIVLNSSATNRRVRLRAGGNVFFQPSYDDETTSGQIIVTVDNPVKQVEFTGAQNDTWEIF